MGAETVSETLDYNAILERQVTRENFTSLSHRKSLKSYNRWADRQMVNTLTTFYVTQFRNRIHNSRPLERVLTISRMNHIHTIAEYVFEIHFNIIIPFMPVNRK
jgi:hypothetical protein